MLSAQTTVTYETTSEKPLAKYLQAEIHARTGWNLEVLQTRSPAAGAVTLQQIGNDKSECEDYNLTAGPTQLVMRASSDAGLFYAVQTLLQMFDAQGIATGRPVTLPTATITDAPQFSWRGLLLDESDHFFGKQTVEELLDAMAYLKLNRLHWHLTDDAGWRIEIKRYPKLTQIGGKGNWSDPRSPTTFYTQADIREIVAYAQQRHIIIIPEVDMPGHATAATRAYPEISEGGKGEWADFTFNPARRETYEFLRQVLQELDTLFPGPYLHLGGDEVSFGNQPWSTDPEILQFSRQHGLANAVELEHYFVRRMAAINHDLGKTTMGWDEITGAGVPPATAAIMWWRHNQTNALIQALKQGYPVVLCPRLPCYFDYDQDATHRYGRRFEERFNRLEDVYDSPGNNVMEILKAFPKAKIMGLEACLWTEWMPDRTRLDYMTFPRLAAFAEAAWTPPSAKNQADFLERTKWYLQELDRRKIPHYNPFNPSATPEPFGPKNHQPPP